METAPQALRVTARTLELDYGDGTRAVLTFARLRQHCPCAECRQRRRHGDVPVLDPSIVVVDAQPYGANALHLTFSDGHTRGIFPFPYLAELARERTAAEHSS